MEDNITIYSFMSAIVALGVVIFIYLCVRFILNRGSFTKSGISFLKQSILFLIVTAGLFVVIFSLPITDTSENRIIELLGYAISAIIALSSATIFGNILAGVLLRIINNFKPGDYIEVSSHFGRITERGLFHTEIQTTDRNLITLPNLYLAVNPVKVTRSSGTFISTMVSLGYDVSRLSVEQCLMRAAERAGLTDAFVYITALGDFSVVYKIHGKQANIKRVPSATSRLNAMVLDELHAENIEIVSPNFMNQRPVGDAVFIPKDLSFRLEDLQENLNADMLVFDKAEQVETIGEQRKRIEKIDKKIKELNEQSKHAAHGDEEELSKIVARYKEVRVKMEHSLESKMEEFRQGDQGE